jgi:HSP20 family protein
MPERDLFANFERMRREMDELFGDVFDRGLAPRRRGGFMPAVDVYYVGDPPRAVVRADLAGIDPRQLELEIRGRELILGGQRVPRGADQERLYQQLEIEHGPFRRVVSLGADVDADRARATYEDGMLVIELPIAAPADPRAVPIEPRRRAPREGGS